MALLFLSAITGSSRRLSGSAKPNKTRNLKFAPPKLAGRDKLCVQFAVHSAISPENPHEWAFEVSRTADAVGFTEYRENIEVIQAENWVAGFEVTDSG